ncbi:MAG: hypothetical protein HDQ98_05215 [Lachnospiraceae bacterium]|nr:hypothetical protein [Lachnospiraceae bacterium]
MNNTALSASVQLSKQHTWFLETGNMKILIMRNQNRQSVGTVIYKVLMYISGILEIARGISPHYQKFCHRQKSMEEKDSAENSVNGNKK